MATDLKNVDTCFLNAIQVVDMQRNSVVLENTSPIKDEYWASCSTFLAESNRRQRKEKRGREKGDRLQFLASKLAKHSEVWEFGLHLDLSEVRDVEIYLQHLQHNISRWRVPKDISEFSKAGGIRLSKPYRYAAYSVLASYGCKKSALICKLYHKRLSQKDLDNFDDTEGQVEIDNSVLATAIVAIITALATAGIMYSRDKILALVDHVGIIAGGIKKGEEAGGMLVRVATTLKEACKCVWRWFKDLCVQVLTALDISNWDFTAMLTHFITIVLALLAFEYARTLMPNFYDSIREYILSKLDVDHVEGQGGHGLGFYLPGQNHDDWYKEHIEGLSTMGKCMEFIRVQYAKVHHSMFYGVIGDLPKFVNVAKSVQWIVQNCVFLYNRILEMWSGEIKPRSEVEASILQFNERVTDLDHSLKDAEASDFKTQTTSTDLAACMFLKTQCRNMVQHARETIRPFFLTMLSTTTEKLDKIQHLYERQEKAAKKRPVPVWLYIHGKPGVGKSRSVEHIIVHVWEYLRKLKVVPDIDWGNENLYLFEQEEDFADGYKGQIVTLIDDLFQVSDVAIRQKMAAKLIYMVSPTPYSMRVATVEDKAHTFFKSKLIITTSNVGRSFKTENLGLASPEALEERRAIVVEAVQTNGEVSFVLDQESRLTTAKGQRITELNIQELAVLVGSMIFQREQEKQEKITVEPMPREPFEYRSSILPARCRARFTLNNYAVMDAVGQGKTKEPEPEEEIEELIEQEEADTVFLNSRKGDTIKLQSICSDLDYGYVMLNLKPELEAVIREFDNDVKHLKCPIELPSRAHVLRYCAAILMQREKDNYFASTQGKYSNLSLSRRPMTFVSDQAILKRLPQSVVIAMFRKAPWLVLEAPSHVLHENAQQGRVWKASHTTQQFFKQWVLSHHSNHAHHYHPCEVDRLDYTFWDPLVDKIISEGIYKEFSAEDIMGYWNKASKRKALFNYLLIGAGLLAVGIAACLTLLKVFMPESAHREEGQASYEYQLKQRERKNAYRAKKNARKEAGVMVKAEGQNSNGVLNKINKNYEIVEVRHVPKNCSKDNWHEYPVETSSWCLFVGGGVAIVPQHTIYLISCQPGMKRIISLARHHEYMREESELEELEVLPGDLILVKFPGIEKPKILGHFAQTEHEYGALELIEPQVDTTRIFVKRGISWQHLETPKVIDMGSFYGTYECDMAIHGIPNKKGMCGLVYYSPKTNKIVAIHQAGSPQREVAFAVQIFHKDIEKHIEGYVVVDPIPINDDTSYQCNQRKGIIVRGMTMPGGSSFLSKKTNLTVSKFDLEKCPLEMTNDSPAILVHPALNNAMDKFAEVQDRGNGPAPPITVEDVLPADFERQNCGDMSTFEAVHGIPGRAKSIDMTSSAGYKYKKQGYTRKHLCYEGDKPIVHDILFRDSEKIYKGFELGIIHPVVYEEQLKDEIRSEAKIKAIATRLYSSGDFASLIAIRRKLGKFIIEAMKDPAGCPIALAINPHSKEWGDLYYRLKGLPEEDRQLIAGDFTGYDIRIKWWFVYQFVRLVLAVHRDKTGLAEAILSSFLGVHVLAQLIFERWTGTSSGSLITSIFNTFVNWLAHKMAWCAIYPEEEWHVVRCAFVGDDSILTVPAKYSKYNMTYLRAYFWDTWRMVYTSPTKDDNMHVTWEEVTFLKRKFVPGVMGVMAPLSLASMANTVKWTTLDADYEVMQSVAQSLLLESFHHGEKLYGQMYEFLRGEEWRLNQNWRLLEWGAMLALRKPDYY